jgi:amino acid transporter
LSFKKDLTYFDLTNLVIGSIVGADIYIASALTAGLVGPSAILIWAIAGVFAIVIALVFAYCSYYVPRIGGPYSFVTAAFDDFYGFLTGWSIWIAELLALPVFAIAFVRYLQYFIPLGFVEQFFIKGLFFFLLTYSNIRGVKAAGRINDVLTIVKLSPLVLLVLAGFLFFYLNPTILIDNYTPFAPLGWKNFGSAVVLVFWAYVGFEMGTLPAAEVKNPKKTIPKAIITGMSIVTIFYLLTNFVVYGSSDWSLLAQSSTPLILTAVVFMGTFGGILLGIGALVSVAGSDESGILGTARLSYAMSLDGLFPKIFSKLHQRYKTPYMALLIQGVIAFILSLYTEISALISFSVFNFAFAFLLTCLALIVLKKKKTYHLHGQRILPWIGIVICLFLIYSTTFYDKIIGIFILLIGIFLYVVFSPKTDIHHLKTLFYSEEAIFLRRMQQKERFLAHFLEIIHRIYKKRRQHTVK